MAPKLEPLIDPLFNISDNTYLIAGAGGGLGNVMAKALAERGARLALFDIDEAALQRVGITIPDALTQVADINDQSALSEMMQLTQSRFGTIDGAINAAGLLPMAAAATFMRPCFANVSMST